MAKKSVFRMTVEQQQYQVVQEVWDDERISAIDKILIVAQSHPELPSVKSGFGGSKEDEEKFLRWLGILFGKEKDEVISTYQKYVGNKIKEKIGGKSTS